MQKGFLVQKKFDEKSRWKKKLFGAKKTLWIIFLEKKLFGEIILVGKKYFL